MSQREMQQPNKHKKGKWRGYRAQNISVFFLLWAVFTAFSFFLIAVLGISQYTATTSTYKREAEKQLREQGPQIQADVLYELETEKTSTPSACPYALNIPKRMISSD